MSTINLDDLKFPIIKCTTSQYSNITIPENDVIYVITDAVTGAPTMYMNNSPLSNIESGDSGIVESVNNILPDSVGNIQLTANDVDTYDKIEINNKIGSALNIQYLKAPINSLNVISEREVFYQYSYPITSKNTVIYEDENTIKYIISSISGSTSKLYIRTMNKETHAYSDEYTNNEVSIAGNTVGYSLIAADETYCYFSKTQTDSNGSVPVNFYRLNHTVPSSAMEARANFPSTFAGVSFVKAGTVIYRFGGTSTWGSAPWNSIWKYNIPTNAWTVMSITMATPGYLIVTSYDDIRNRIYISYGIQTNTSSTWSQKYVQYFDISTETIIALPDRSVNAYNGIIFAINNGIVAIPLTYRSGNTYNWGELGSQLYIPELNQWVSFNSGIPFKTGSSSSGVDGSSSVSVVGLDGNTVHLIVDGLSYKLSLNFTTIGLFSKDESLYINAYTKADQNVIDANDNVISAGTIIPPATEIKIINTETRVTLITNVTTDGSWIRRPPTTITGTASETVLWDGNIGTSDTQEVSNTITLSNSVFGYNKVRFHVIMASGNNRRHTSKEFEMYDLFETLIAHGSDPNYELAISDGFSDTNNYTIIESNSDSNHLNIRQSQSYLKKVVGIAHLT